MSGLLRCVLIAQRAQADVFAELTADAIQLATGDEESRDTIAVDLDGTLAHHRRPFSHTMIGDPIDGAREAVEHLKKLAPRVVILTARPHLAAVRAWVQRHNIPVDDVTNVKDHTQRLFIDDRGCHFSGDWPSTLKRAEARLKKHDAEELSTATAEPTEWVSYQGRRGGKGWRSAQTGRIVYQLDMPGGHQHVGAQQQELVPAEGKSEHAAYHAIKEGDLGYVQGFPVRRTGKDRWRLLEIAKGHVEGAPEDVQAHINEIKRHEANAKPMIDRALDRAKNHTEPDFFREPDRVEKEAKAFDSLPHGAHVVSLEPHTRGRLGQIIRRVEDGRSVNRVKLHGIEGWAGNHVEPLDVHHSWRMPHEEKPEEKPPAPKMRQGFLFSTDGENWQQIDLSVVGGLWEKVKSGYRSLLGKLPGDPEIPEKEVPEDSEISEQESQPVEGRVSGKKVDARLMMHRRKIRRFIRKHQRLMEKLRHEPEMPEEDLPEDGEVEGYMHGEWLPVTSSNVTAIRYLPDDSALEVEYHGSNEHGPSFYRYEDIPPGMALSFARARSPGGWVWDNLRVRGTVYSYQKPYSFISGPSTYQPKWMADAASRLRHGRLMSTEDMTGEEFAIALECWSAEEQQASDRWMEYVGPHGVIGRLQLATGIIEYPIELASRRKTPEGPGLFAGVAEKHWDGPHQGPRGGTYWVSVLSGRKLYRKDQPGEHEHEGVSDQEPAEPAAAAKPDAPKLDITADDVHNWSTPYVQSKWRDKLTPEQRDAMKAAERRHHQKGTSAKDESERLIKEFSTSKEPEPKKEPTPEEHKEKAARETGGTTGRPHDVFSETNADHADVLLTQGVRPDFKRERDVQTFGPGSGLERGGLYVAKEGGFSKGSYGRVRLHLTVGEDSLDIPEEMKQLGYAKGKEVAGQQSLDYVMKTENGAVTKGEVHPSAFHKVEVYEDGKWDGMSPKEYLARRGIKDTPRLPSMEEYERTLRSRADELHLAERHIQQSLTDYNKANLADKIYMAQDLGLVNSAT